MRKCENQYFTHTLSSSLPKNVKVIINDFNVLTDSQLNICKRTEEICNKDDKILQLSTQIMYFLYYVIFVSMFSDGILLDYLVSFFK